MIVIFNIEIIFNIVIIYWAPTVFFVAHPGSRELLFIALGNNSILLNSHKYVIIEKKIGSQLYKKFLIIHSDKAQTC